MISKITDFALQWKGLSVLFLIGLLISGIYSYANMPVDAFPDISPIMVPIFAEADGMAPEEIERLITYPIESTMNGLPGVTKIKSTSAFGLAVIYVYFSEDTDIYFARQLVSERLSSSLSDLPKLEEQPKLGPISTGLGQIFIYYLEADDSVDTQGKGKLTYLRDLNDWVVKFQLQTIPGVTDILSIGGHILQYQIKVNPYSLHEYSISLEDIIEAINKSNRNTGGQYLTLGSEEHLVRGIGLLKNIKDIENIPLTVKNGTPVTIKNVAKVEFGKEIRRGVVSYNGEKELVSGLVLKLFGENTSAVITRLNKKIPEIQASLPKGVKIVPYYEQAHLVNKATWTVEKSLLQGAALVLLVLLVFLGNFKASVIVAFALPFCACIAFIGMRFFGISANLMSLGGIAIGLGMLVDGSIVVVENIVRHMTLDKNSHKSKMQIMHEATVEVGRPITFAILIVVAVFLPILSLQGVEGKMFSPMAYTIGLALLGSILAALIMAPVLSMLLLKIKNQHDTIVFSLLKNPYLNSLKFALTHAKKVIGLAVLAVVISIIALSQIGTEFIPALEEGSIMIGVTMAPSISLDSAMKTVQIIEKKLVKTDGVKEIISRIGRPEAGSHPHPVNYAEVHIELTDPNTWKTHKSKAEIVATLRQKLTEVTGITYNFTQPIQNAFDELLSGTRAQIAIQLYGEDLNILKSKAEEILHATENIKGFSDPAVEQSFGQPQVKVIADREACARYGVAVEEILELVETAIGGSVVDYLYLNTRRYGINLRYDEESRKNPEAIEQLLVHTADGSTVSLDQVAQIKLIEGPVQINRQNNQRRWIVQGNVSGRALGDVIFDIKKAIKEKVKLPPGYLVEYGGQFENQQRAMSRLAIIIPIVVAIIFFLLWFTFHSPKHAAIVMVNIPMALIGGVLGLLITGQYLSVPASVGFIALLGIAMQDAVVMVTDFNDLRKQGKSVKNAVIEGGMLRFRPVLMTTMTTLLGLLPLLVSAGIGAEVQRPLAATVVFGLASSTLLTLYVIPSIYLIIESYSEKA